MSRWSSLVQDLKQVQPGVELSDPDQASITFSYEGGRLQKVVVRRIVARGTEWCEITAAVGEPGRVQPMELLALNARTTLGGICFLNGIYVLRYMTMLDATSAAGLAEYVRVLAGRADAIERSVFAQDEF